MLFVRDGRSSGSIALWGRNSFTFEREGVFGGKVAEDMSIYGVKEG